MPTQAAPGNTSHIWHSLDEIESALLRDALEHWNGLRGNRRWPTREDLKLRNIKVLLPYISLVRVIDGGVDFEHRIVGDALVQAFAVPIQNRRLTDIAWEAPELIASTFDVFHRALTAQAPISWLMDSQAEAQYPAYFRFEFLLMPLGDTEDHIDHLLVCGVGTRRIETDQLKYAVFAPHAPNSLTRP